MKLTTQATDPAAGRAPLEAPLVMYSTREPNSRPETPPSSYGRLFPMHVFSNWVSHSLPGFHGGSTRASLVEITFLLTPFRLCIYHLEKEQSI